MRVVLMVVVGTLVVFAVAGCPARDLRGKAVASADGKTYLVVDDDNGGACGQLKVDGRAWRHPIHSPGKIMPGVHELACGDGPPTGFEISKGTTFHFDYWGP